MISEFSVLFYAIGCFFSENKGGFFYFSFFLLYSTTYKEELL